MSESLLDCYAERIQAWRKATASLSYSAIDPKRNAVELYDELAALKRENEYLAKVIDNVWAALNEAGTTTRGARGQMLADALLEEQEDE